MPKKLETGGGLHGVNTHVGPGEEDQLDTRERVEVELRQFQTNESGRGKREKRDRGAKEKQEQKEAGKEPGGMVQGGEEGRQGERETGVKGRDKPKADLRRQTEGERAKRTGDHEQYTKKEEKTQTRTQKQRWREGRRRKRMRKEQKKFGIQNSIRKRPGKGRSKK